MTVSNAVEISATSHHRARMQEPEGLTSEHLPCMSSSTVYDIRAPKLVLLTQGRVESGGPTRGVLYCDRRNKENCRANLVFSLL